MTHSERLTAAIIMYREGVSFHQIERKYRISSEEIFAALKIPSPREKPKPARKKTKCDSCCWKTEATGYCILPNCFLKSIGNLV